MSGGRNDPDPNATAEGQPDRESPPAGSEDPHRAQTAAPARPPRTDPPPAPRPGELVREGEIARMIALGVHPQVARWLWSWEESEPEDSVDRDLARWLPNFRRSRSSYRPIPTRAASDGGDFVQTSGQASPIAAHEPPPDDPPSVVLRAEPSADPDRDAPTAVTGRRTRRWPLSWPFRRP